MFGSKIRTWMENHIVRPRKKEKKNKNQSNGIVPSAQNTHKGNANNAFNDLNKISANSTTTIPQLQPPPSSSSSTGPSAVTSIGSPARRCEVSPIQNHKASRKGWQSPNHEMPHTICENDPIGFNYMMTKKHQQQQQQQQHQLHANTQLTQGLLNGDLPPMIRVLSPNQSQTSSPNFSQRHASLSRTTTQSQSSSNHYYHTLYNTQKHPDEKYFAQTSQLASVQQPQHIISNSSNAMSISTCSSNTTKSLSSMTSSTMTSSFHRTNGNDSDYRKSGISQASSSSTNSRLLRENYFNSEGDFLYNGATGKYEPITLSSSSSSSLNSKTSKSSKKAIKGYATTNEDHLDEIHFRNGKISQCDQFNGNAIVQKRQQQQINNATTNFNNKSIKQTTNINNNTANLTPVLYRKNNNGSTKTNIRSTTNGNNGNNLLSGPTARFTSAATATTTSSMQSIQTVNHHQQQQQQHHHQQQSQQQHLHSHSQVPPHLVNTLSSPESAYSTGYSTDGTSPGGCSVAPECYYINIRTGTHYFPKGTGAAGGGGGVAHPLGIDNANRFKCALNRIDEKQAETIQTTDYKKQVHYHRRTESCDITTSSKLGDVNGFSSKESLNANCLSPLPHSRSNTPQYYRSIESPSPRQRCRIRTNPWLSETTTISTIFNSTTCPKGDMETSSTSSGIKSNSDINLNEHAKEGKLDTLSDSDTTSSTEKHVSRKLNISKSNNVNNNNKDVSNRSDRVSSQRSGQQSVSDDDATLNEMIGKFDESYVYEKETDILSDSDSTNCATDFDTGQDAGDECDTDDLLEMDYIDKGSMQEVTEKVDKNKNKGSCSYHPLPQQVQQQQQMVKVDKRSAKLQKFRQEKGESVDGKRKKKYIRTRKKQHTSNSHTSNASSLTNSPRLSVRGCRSVGGTPVCLRRNQLRDSQPNNPTNMSPLSNRSNSLTFTEVYSIHNRMLALSDSEKALLKADLEADFKYKQLIHEAETILVSMKTNALKEGMISSPRRINNLPTNKRLEMLKHEEVELKRELSKTQNPKTEDGLTPNEGVIVNKRLEIVKHDAVSTAPNSPNKSARVCPLKTHVTNFINQNVDPNELQRNKKVPPDPPPRRSTLENGGGRPISPHNKMLQNGLKSPIPEHRKIRSHSLQPQMESDSEEEEVSRASQRSSRMKVVNVNQRQVTMVEKSRIVTRANTVNGQEAATNGNESPMITFRSVDIGYSIPDIFYCPQSEPLKRKVYSGSTTYDKIQKKLDEDQESSPRRQILQKISQMRREKQNRASRLMSSSSGDRLSNSSEFDSHHDFTQTKRQQLIMSTIEDIKRSLLDQSIELNGLHDSDT
ncbi:probable serine/threonine-protein kinase DDB_G0282963 [Culicoides brevitarsis]|uniref:probable serine/threonine-protein kinase DDB_G0282963 n=1 Tax=Culicoides brevitarsis TaxID=469753 RepID=UPI00307B4C7A